MFIIKRLFADLPYFFDYGVFVLSTLLPVFNLFSQIFISPLLPIFKLFFQFLSLNCCKTVLVFIKLWFKSLYIAPLHYLPFFLTYSVWQYNPRNFNLISYSI